MSPALRVGDRIHRRIYHEAWFVLTGHRLSPLDVCYTTLDDAGPSHVVRSPTHPMKGRLMRGPTNRRGLEILDDGPSRLGAQLSTHPMTPKAEDALGRLLWVMQGSFETAEVWSTEHWVCVDLVIDEPGVLENGTPFTYLVRRRFAIWQYTGNVYRVDKHGAAEDDPFLWVSLFTTHIASAAWEALDGD